jgi:tetratricopeptide (TPR) repeat protein
MFSLLIVTGLVIAARRHRYLLVGWFWFLGALVPMIGLVQVGSQAMADRYAYLPFVGLFTLVCWGVADWAAAQHVSMIWVAAVGATCILGLAMVAHRQIGFWKDNVTLWSHAVEVTPPNFIAEDNLGGALIEAGRTDEAIAHFQRAAAIEPSDPMSRLNLAANEQRHGNIPQAISKLTGVIEATNDRRLRATAFTDLGYCYRQLGDRVHAERSFQTAVGLRPSAFRAWVGLGLLAQTSGDSAEAVKDYSRSLAVQPWDLSYFLLARALQQSGRTEESQAALQQAKRLSSNFNQLQQVGDELLAK